MNSRGMALLFMQDQADRHGDDIDWPAVRDRDRARRGRAQELLASGDARTAVDFYHAAMVFHHGECLADYERARELAEAATMLDPGNRATRWLVAATEDRALLHQGKPQKWGTQLVKDDDRWRRARAAEMDPSVSEQQRLAWARMVIDDDAQALLAHLEACRRAGSEPSMDTLPMDRPRAEHALSVLARYGLVEEGSWRDR